MLYSEAYASREANLQHVADLPLSCIYHRLVSNLINSQFSIHQCAKMEIIYILVIYFLSLSSDLDLLHVFYCDSKCLIWDCVFYTFKLYWNSHPLQYIGYARKYVHPKISPAAAQVLQVSRHFAVLIAHASDVCIFRSLIKLVSILAGALISFCHHK